MEHAMSTRHKLIGRSTYTGSDTLKFYDAGDGDVYIVHVQEWEDLDSAAVAEYGKYNAVAHHVNVRGFDCPTDEDGQQTVWGVGASVINSLKSCGFDYREWYELGAIRAQIESEQGDIIAKGPRDSVAIKLVIAEAMYGYGAGDRVLDSSGNNARVLEREARNAF